jgi:hypothetical protein
MTDKLINEVANGIQDVKDLSSDAIKELDQILNELTKIAKKDHLSPTQNPRDRRKKIEAALEPYVKKLGGAHT